MKILSKNVVYKRSEYSDRYEYEGYVGNENVNSDFKMIKYFDGRHVFQPINITKEMRNFIINWIQNREKRDR